MQTNEARDGKDASSPLPETASPERALAQPLARPAQPPRPSAKPKAAVRAAEVDGLSPGSVGVVACGAIARELNQLKRLNGWTNMVLHCLPAELHNRPERIPAEVAAKLAAIEGRHARVFVAYADCGTGGLLDAELVKTGTPRLPGAHCYEFLSGPEAFAALAEEEPGTFYLTDFLVRHFDRLVRQGLGLDRHPQLRDEYFRNYRRLLHLSQSGDDALRRKAAAHADSLQLRFEHRHTGLSPFARALQTLDVFAPVSIRSGAPQSR